MFDQNVYVGVSYLGNKSTSNIFSRIPDKVLVEPGRRYIIVRYNNEQGYAFGRLWLDAEAGKTYIVKIRIKNYSIIFWAEDEKTGETVWRYLALNLKKIMLLPPKLNI